MFVSSGAVYDGLTGDVSPATPVSPRLPYAISKLASEQYIRFFAERRGTLASYINVRFFGAYGPYEAERKITTRWLRAMAAGQREFVVRGDGQNLIDFMYVDDAVDGLLALLRRAASVATVDFASGAPVSVDDVVQAMARALGVAVTDSPRRRRAGIHRVPYRRYHDARPLRRRAGDWVRRRLRAAQGVLRQQAQSQTNSVSKPRIVVLARARPACRRPGGCPSSGIRSRCSSATTRSAAWAGRSRSPATTRVDFGPHTFHIRETDESREVLEAINRSSARIR